MHKRCGNQIIIIILKKIVTVSLLSYLVYIYRFVTEKVAFKTTEEGALQIEL